MKLYESNNNDIKRIWWEKTITKKGMIKYYGYVKLNPN